LASKSAPLQGVSQLSLGNRWQAAFLAWLIPGLGHWYQGRRGKAILYAVCIMGLFFVGLALGDFKNVFWRWTSPSADPERFRFIYLCQFFVGLPALPALVQSTLQHYSQPFVLWGYLAEPSMNALNAVHVKSGRLAEVGWVYTVIAGLLNILAIYDAFEGPAHGEDDAAEDAELRQKALPVNEGRPVGEAV
jgi:hypothetical protein